jgi:hypothetical protein
VAHGLAEGAADGMAGGRGQGNADASVHFPLDGAAADARLVYRPWGTRTLKVRLTTGRDLPALRLRPRVRAPADSGLISGGADEGAAFVVSWGGGHEPGPCLKAEDFLHAFERCAPLVAGEASTLFFNVRHVGPDAPEAVLTLEAFDEATGRVHSALPVRLDPPPLPADLIRMVPDGAGGWVAGDGGHLPRYDSRWWPAGTVDYVAASPPPLAVRRAGPSLEVVWGSAAEPVARIQDLTEPSVLDQADAVDLELFAFGEGLLGLRVWFFWLDLRLGPRFFVGRHEVPDVERFDLVLRAADGRVVAAASDAHWRELWATTAEPPAPAIECVLGLDAATKLALIRETLGPDDGGAPPMAGPYNPLGHVMGLAAARATPIPGGGASRGKGTEAHLPTFRNVEQPEPRQWLTSSDVRLG